LGAILAAEAPEELCVSVIHVEHQLEGELLAKFLGWRSHEYLS
jgi:hypothetical protein